MTRKQIDLYNQIVNLCNGHDAEDIITATSCIMCRCIEMSGNQRELGYSIQNLVYRQIQFFSKVNKGKQIPILEDVPKFNEKI